MHERAKLRFLCQENLWIARVSSSFLEGNSMVRCNICRRHWASFLAEWVTWNSNSKCWKLPRHARELLGSWNALFMHAELTVPTTRCKTHTTRISIDMLRNSFPSRLISRLWDTLTSTMTGPPDTPRPPPRPHFFLWAVLKAPFFSRHIQQRLRSWRQRFKKRFPLFRSKSYRMHSLTYFLG